MTTLLFYREKAPSNCADIFMRGYEMNYSIKSGDCLWNIVKKNYRTDDGKTLSNAQIANTVNSLARMNNIKDANLIFAGDTLKLAAFDTFTLMDSDDEELEIDSQTYDSNIETGNNLNGQDIETATNASDAESPYQAFGGWIAEILQNAANKGASAGSTVSKENLMAEEYDKQYNVIYGEAYQSAIANAPDFSILESGDSAENYSANPIEMYAKIAQSQIEKMDTIDNDGTINLKEFLISEINGYNNTSGDTELSISEESIDKFIQIYEQYPELTSKNEDFTTLRDIAKIHNFFDFNSDGKLDDIEIKQYYRILDVSDSKDNTADGKIEYSSYLHWNLHPGLTSNEYARKVELESKDNLTSEEEKELKELKAQEKEQKTNFTEQYKTLYPEKFE